MTDQVQIEIIRTLGTAVPSSIAALFAYLGLRQGQRTHNQINGRMDQMLKLTRESGQTEGRKEGFEEGQEEHKS